jgi:hypothetical protein
MSHACIAVLSAAAIDLTVSATPTLAQTFNGFYNNDPAVTNGYAPYEPQGGYYNNGSSGVPVIGPVVGVLAAPFTAAGAPQARHGCFLDRDFNGRYTAMCGM